MDIYLDIETTAFFQDDHIKRLPRSQQIGALARDHFGVALTYDASHGWREWWQGDTPALVDAIAGHRVIGWNVIDFDLPLLFYAANHAGYNDASLNLWYALDLFAECRTRTGRWYKLEQVAQANLGRGKSGDGQQASEWLRSGDAALRQRAVEYCKLDVQLTIDLHKHAQAYGLLLPARPKDTPDIYRLYLDAPGWRLEDEHGVEMDKGEW